MPAQLECHFGISSADTGNRGEPWWELDEDKNTEVQNVKLFLWHYRHYFVLLSVWSTAARVLINFYLRSATLTSTTLWNELRSSLWELEQRLLSRRATISRVCVEKEREADEQHERNWLIFIQRYFGQILELLEMTQWALNGFHRPPGRKTFPDHKRLNHWCT